MINDKDYIKQQCSYLRGKCEAYERILLKLDVIISRKEFNEKEIDIYGK